MKVSRSRDEHTSFFCLPQVDIPVLNIFILCKNPACTFNGEFDAVFVQSLLPYQLSSPEVRLTVKPRRNLDWIAGYQYMDYKEQFANNQFYQAHLPYTSLRFYMGRVSLNNKVVP